MEGTVVSFLEIVCTLSAAGFVCGYSLRDRISRERHREAARRLGYR